MITKTTCDFDQHSKQRNVGTWLARNFILSAVALLCLCTTSVQAAELVTSLEKELQTTISGTVTDENGDPLPGANVVVKGTTNGTQTDFDGNYTITADANATLVFSYIGFLTQEVQVNGQSSVSVQLSPDANELDEVVIVGYQAQTRGDLTGAVASVDIEDANKQVVTSAAEVLQGRVSGVSVTNNGSVGQAPTIRIRGVASPNQNDPLIIIDGVQTQDRFALNNINPNDIAQFNVLKDASAAIYGARASNGVIIITTKSGSYNKALTVDVNVHSGFRTVSGLPDLLNAQQLGEVFFQSLRNDGQVPSHPQFGNGPNPVVPNQLNINEDFGDGLPVTATVNPNGTDWLDEIFRTALEQEASIGLSAGNEVAKFNFSSLYTNREDIHIGTSFKRGIVRLNSEFKIGNRVTVGQHFNGTFTRSNGGNQVQNALRISPLIPVRDDQGRFAGAYSPSAGLANATNPVANLLRVENINFFRGTNASGDIYASWEIVDGLTAKTQIAGIANNFTVRNFTPLNPEHSEPLGVNTLNQQFQENYTWTFTNTLNYSKSFGKHTVNALIGLEAIEETQLNLNSNNTDFLFETPEFLEFNNARGDALITSSRFRNTLSSIFGTVNYTYDSKYLFTGSLRRDRSSRFAGDNQSDVFPAVSAGWVLSNEDFFPDDIFLNRVKFKGSWGELGNQNLPVSNPDLNIFGFNVGTGNFPFDGNTNIASGVVLSAPGNADLRWETSRNINAGVELDFFDSKLRFSGEYFKNTAEDLLAPGVALQTGPDAPAAFVNAGNIENEGFDFSISYGDTTKGGLTYNIDATLSTFDNTVIALPNTPRFGQGFSFIGSSPSRTEEGGPIGSFFGRVVDGIYRSEQEVIDGPDQGFATPADGVGRLRYRDLNSDGIINDDDREVIGNPHPDFTFGVNLSASYKNFDISAFFSGVVGNDLYHYNRIFTDFATFPNNGRSTRVLDAFDPVTNPNGSQPSLSFIIPNSETQPNSFFIEDGSFLRLTNLQIGYNLPNTITDKLGLGQLRVYLTGTNIFTITGYDGLTPDFQTRGGGDAFTLGIDEGNTPITQTYILGINVKL